MSLSANRWAIIAQTPGATPMRTLTGMVLNEIPEAAVIEAATFFKAWDSLGLGWRSAFGIKKGIVCVDEDSLNRAGNGERGLRRTHARFNVS